jgi:Zn-dependent M28 family amino/carboxypeptidase
MKKAPKDAVPLTIEEKMENKIVTMRIGKQLADALFKGTGKTMSELHSLIDADLTPQSFEIPGKTIVMETTLSSERKPTQNVMGLLEGSDTELKEEIVVICAHYDHLGAPNDTTIYNGADDNASGTVGVMCLAKAFHACKERQKRSILFCAWAGEEKGLFGSRYYVNTSPIFPIEKTVTTINMDMIGRNDSSKVTISGFTSSDDLKEITINANEDIGLEIDDSKGIRGSDHVPFYQKKIPVLGFFTGFHPDYHKPTDTADKCFPDGAIQICKLVFKIAWNVADAENPPEYIEPEK